MSLYYPSNVPAIAQNVLMRLERTLPLAGDILVAEGSRVEPDTVVSRCFMEEPPVVFNLAKAGGVAPKKLAKKLKKPVGSRVEENNVLAGRNGKAPVTGTFSAYDPDTGLATITPEPRQIQQTAFVRGVVAEIPDNQTVVIETSASYLRGIFGFGGQRSGVLHTTVTDPTEEITPDLIDERLTYFIIVGGSCISAAALRRAVDLNVRGVIVGGIEEKELHDFLGLAPGPGAWQIGQNSWEFPSLKAGWTAPLTLIVVEGFGKIPLSSKAFEMLASYEGQEVSIDGTTQLRQGLKRPEVIIPLGKLGGVPNNEIKAVPVEVGRTVHVVTPPFLGAIGRIVELPSSPRALPSGVLTAVAEIKLENGNTVSIPLNGFEILW